jgi:PAS domain S-box-containing protein
MAMPLRVLIVEDSEADTRLMLRELGHGGYAPTWTRVETVDAMRTTLAREAWDLILADYTMPQFSGLAALRLLQEMELDIPFIVVSGTIGEEIAVDAMRAGAQDYLLKDNLARLAPAVTRELADAKVRQARRQAVEEVHIVNRGLRMLSAVNEALLRATTIDALLHSVCQIAVETGGYRLVWIGMAEHDDAHTVHPVCHAGYEEGYLSTSRISWADTPLGHGPTGTAIRTGRPAFARDVAVAPEYAPWREEALKRGYRSSIAVPLTFHNHVLGALNLYGGIPDAFPPEQVHLLSEMAGDLAYGIMALRTREKREQAEEALRESEQRFANAFTYAAIGMALVSPEGRWLKVNQAVCAMLGYTDAELLGMTFQDVTYPDDLTMDLHYVQQMLTGEISTYQMEKRYIQKSGISIWGRLSVSLVRDAQEQPLYFISQIENITDRKQAEHALRVSKEKYRSLVEATSDWIWEVDATGIYTYVSPQVLLLGYTPDEVVGKTLFAFMPPEEAARMGLIVADCLQSRQPLVRVLNRHCHRDGREITLETSAVPILDDGGNLVGYRGIARDVSERIQAEKALKDHADRLRTVLATLPVGVFLLDAEGRIVETNTAVSRIWGGNAPLAPGIAAYRAYRGWWPETGEPLQPEDWAAARAITKGETSIGEIIDIQRFDGTHGTILNSATPLRDADGRITGGVVVIQDITDLRHVQQALEQERAFLRTVIDTVPNFIGVKDWESRFVLANKALAEVYGVTPAALLGKSDADFNPNPAEVAWFHRDDQEVIRTRTRKFIPEEQITDSTGHQRWLTTVKVPLINPDGSCSTLLLATHDITDRIRAEKETERERAYLAAAIELLPFPIIFFSPTREVVRQNIAGREWAQDPTGRYWWSVRLRDPHTHAELPPGDRPGVRSLRGDVVSASEWQAVLPDGREIPVLIYSAPVLVGDDILAAVVAFQDITAMKEADHAKNQFIRIISHEMRTPLTALIGWAQLAEGDPTLCAEALRAIHHSARVQEGVLDRLILLSRMLTGKLTLQRKPVDLNDVALQVAASYQPVAQERRIGLESVPSAAPLPIMADPELLHHAFGELLENALKYTPAGGQVTMTLARSGTQVVASIHDTGQGIAQEQLPRLGQLFQQIIREEALGGLGIGLVLVRGIIEAHGGQVFITSPGLGQGTTVTVALPEADARLPRHGSVG